MPQSSPRKPGRGPSRRKARANLFRTCVLIACCVFLLAGCAVGLGREDSNPGAGEEARVTVSRVVDGDTVAVTPPVLGRDVVRLIGVDTPERGEPLQAEAARFARENLEGERVTLELDEETEDDYGRLLAHVYLPNGGLFGESLLREGYAQVATFPPNISHLDRFEAAQAEAREAGRGIWGLPQDEACRLRDRGNGIGGGC